MIKNRLYPYIWRLCRFYENGCYNNHIYSNVNRRYDYKHNNKYSETVKNIVNFSISLEIIITL